MDLRHARTFVTVAELGTVSKAAVRLRTAQPALSRQISDLEHELGLKLFDRIGRRLRLTGEGEQLLNDCRALLNHASAIGERALVLRRGETGVLKVAASPQFIESVISTVLPRYAQKYPKVQVRLFEAVGLENLAMLERGEIHLGQNLLHAVGPDDQRFASHPLGPVELLAACHRSSTLGRRPSRSAAWPLIRCCCWTAVSVSAALSMRLVALQASSRTFCLKAAPRTPCWRLRKPVTALPSFRRPCKGENVICISRV